MNEQALALAADLETYVEGLVCAPDKIGVTFGEPADPTDARCRTLLVWVASVQGRETAPQDCNVLSRVTLAYRITSCFDVQERDLSIVQHEAAADCLYEIGEAVWCGLVVDKSSGVLMGLDCRQITLGPLVNDPPRGGIASMTGTVTVDIECPIS